MALRATAGLPASASSSRSCSVSSSICVRMLSAVTATTRSRSAIFSGMVGIGFSYAPCQVMVAVPVKRRAMGRAIAQYTRVSEVAGSAL